MSGPAHLRHNGWVIEPDYNAPYIPNTWVASSTDYETSLCAPTYKELLVEIAEFEAEFCA
jgi:hypothetical protein